MTFVEKLVADIGDIKQYKTISKKDLQNLGYIFSDISIAVQLNGTAKTPFRLYEVLDEDSKEPVSFSYLFHIEKDTGLIIKYPFERYRSVVKQIKEERTSKG